MKYQNNKMNDTNVLFEFDIALNPSKKIFRRGIKLLLLENLLVFQDKENIEIPYSSIISLAAVRSFVLDDNMAYLTWSDQSLTFAVKAVKSILNTWETDIDMTEILIKLILALKNKDGSAQRIYTEFLELKKQKLTARKRDLKLWLLLPLLGCIFIILAFMIFKNVEIVLFTFILLFIVGLIFTNSLTRHSNKYFWRATFNSLMGNIDITIRGLEKDVQIQPNNIDINWLLAKLYYRKKDWDKSRLYCQNVLSLNPNYKKARRLMNTFV